MKQRKEYINSKRTTKQSQFSPYIYTTTTMVYPFPLATSLGQTRDFLFDLYKYYQELVERGKSA